MPGYFNQDHKLLLGEQKHLLHYPLNRRLQKLLMNVVRTQEKQWVFIKPPFEINYLQDLMQLLEAVTNLIFCKRWVPQSYIFPCSVFQIKVIRFKLLKILEEGKMEKNPENQKTKTQKVSQYLFMNTPCSPLLTKN